eukprot:13397423-Ditylum_brightwellii.AAC.1
MDNNTVCSDNSDDTRSNNIDDYSKTDQMGETAPSTFSSAMLYNNKQQKKSSKQSLTKNCWRFFHRHPPFQ